MKLETKKISKFLSLVLRHKPEVIQLQLDEQGWASTTELIEKCNENGKQLNLEMLQHVVENNDKKRFAFNDDGSKIRASQGHSISINLGYKPVEPPQFLYHGTATRFVNSIRKEGLKKRNRQHVHLSKDEATATNVGSRHGKPFILTIDALTMHQQGYKFYISENGVWLTDEVPVGFIDFD